MNNILKKMKENKQTCALLLIVISFCVIFLFGISKSTYSADPPKDTLSLICPKVAGKGEKINCQVIAKFDLSKESNNKYFSVNANYEFDNTILKYDSFALANCEGDECLSLYSSSMNGFAIGNVNGIKNESVLGEISFTILDNAMQNQKYPIELKNIELSTYNTEANEFDKEMTIFDNISTEVRIKSSIATLDSIKVNDTPLADFNTTKLEYELDFDSNVKEVLISYTKTDVNSKATGNGTSGIKVPIHYGSNVFDIEVTSEDESKTTKYKVNVKRKYDFNTKVEKYKKIENKLYVGDDTDEGILNSLEMLEDNMTYHIEKDILKILYGKETIQELPLLRFTIEGHNILDHVLYIKKDLTYSEFQNLVKTNNLEIKVVDNDHVLEEGTVINIGNKLEIYYESEKIDTYPIQIEYLKMDDTLTIDDNLKIIKRLPLGMTYLELKNKILSSGTISIISYDNTEISENSVIRTNNQIKIKMSNKELIYTLSVAGDINGDGALSIIDVDMLYRYRQSRLVPDDPDYDVPVTKAGIAAGDIINDGSIEITDVDVLYRYNMEKKKPIVDSLEELV